MSEKGSGGGAAAIHRKEARPEPAEGGLADSSENETESGVTGSR